MAGSRSARRVPCLVALASAIASAIASPSAGAQDREPEAVPDAYPLTLAVDLAGPSRAARYENYTPGGVSGPPTPAGTVAVGELVFRAWTALARRAFEGRAPGPDLRLAVEIAAADVDLTTDGWVAYLEQRLSLRDGAGAELATWRIRRQSPVVGLGESAIPRAFSRAAAQAIDAFERGFAAAPGPAAFLAARGIEPRRPIVPVSEYPAAPAAAPADPPRTGGTAFLQAGAMVIPSGPTDEPVFGFVARGGVTGAAFVAALDLQVWRMPIERGRYDTTPHLVLPGAELLALSLDLGVVGRPAARHELAAGLGLGLLRATGKASHRTDDPYGPGAAATAVGGREFLPALFGSYAYVVPYDRWRGRVAVEVRRPVGPTPKFDEFRVEMPATDTTLRMLIGIEFPLRR